MRNRKHGLKPRKEGNELPEKLLKVLQTIYPEQVAKELFERLQGEDGDDHG